MWKYSGNKLEVTPDLAYLIEAIKVEGWFSLKHREASIQNKNLPLLRNIERILKDYKIPIRKRLLIKVKPFKQNFLKEDIFVRAGSKDLKFHIEYSVFDGSKKIVFNIPHKVNQNLVLVSKKEKIPINVKVGKETVQIVCKFKSFAYCELKFYSIRFLEFLDKYANGWGTYNIRVHPFLLKKGKKFIAAALSALIDCEGSLNYYDFTRKIRVRMFNSHYLRDWHQLLKKVGIGNGINTEGFTINGWEDFDKLEKLGIRLYHSEKKRKLERIMNSYQKKQVSRGTALEYYTRKLERIGKPVSATEFAQSLGKKKRNVNHYLTQLHKNNKIKVDRSKIKYLYSV